MALVLAEYPVKHPNYPNGDHYAVLDTDTGNVEYFTLVEIQKDIDEEGTQFIGNHPLAIKDIKERNKRGNIIVRTVETKHNGTLNNVYFIKSEEIIVEFTNTGHLFKVRYADFKAGLVQDKGVSDALLKDNYVFVLGEHCVKLPHLNQDLPKFMAYHIATSTYKFLTKSEINKYKEIGYKFIGNNSLASKDTRELSYLSEPILSSGIINNERVNLVYYINGRNCFIEFCDTGFITNVEYMTYLRHQVKNWFKPSVQGIGIVGGFGLKEKYNTLYTIWAGMIDRVKNPIGRRASYKDCSISNYFLFFPNFVTWCLSQTNYEALISFSDCSDFRITLDKDILFKDNKIYSETTCSLVPNKLNSALSNTTSYRDRILPIGVIDDRGRIRASIGYMIDNNLQHEYSDYAINIQFSDKEVIYFENIAKSFHSIDKLPRKVWADIGYCFLWYKERKEAEIKRLAEYWYNYSYNGHTVHVITKECYDALMNWIVDIND